MSNRKRFSIILSSAVFLCGIAVIIVFSFRPIQVTSTLEEKPPTAQGSITEEPGSPTPPKKPLSVHATMLDYTYDIKEMRDESDLIVVGEVISQYEPSRATVGSVVRVNKVFRGEQSDEIVVFQFGQINEETVIEPNKTYLFFLGSQNIEGQYYTKGGEQGIFLIDNGILRPQDIIMKEEFETKFNEEDVFNINAKSTSEFEKWLTE